jgi:hypothetical protein
MIFYSYLWLREDATPYYAGKGHGNRAFIRHRNGGRVVCPPEDKSRIRVFTMLNEAEAFESEIALIDLFGRKDLGTGCLVNLTSGGEGASGHSPSLDTRAKTSAALMGHAVSEKTREKLRGNKCALGCKRTQAYKDAVRQRRLGKKTSPATREKQSLVKLGILKPLRPRKPIC